MLLTQIISVLNVQHLITRQSLAAFFLSMQNFVAPSVYDDINDVLATFEMNLSENFIGPNKTNMTNIIHEVFRSAFMPWSTSCGETKPTILENGKRRFWMRRYVLFLRCARIGMKLAHILSKTVMCSGIATSTIVMKTVEPIFECATEFLEFTSSSSLPVIFLLGPAGFYFG